MAKKTKGEKPKDKATHKKVGVSDGKSSEAQKPVETSGGNPPENDDTKHWEKFLGKKESEWGMADLKKIMAEQRRIISSRNKALTNSGKIDKLKPRVQQYRKINQQWEDAKLRFSNLSKTRTRMRENFNGFCKRRNIELEDFLKNPERYLGEIPEKIDH